MTFALRNAATRNRGSVLSSDAVARIAGNAHWALRMIARRESLPPIPSIESSRRNTHTQPDVVIDVARIIIVTVGRAAVPCIIVVRTAPQHLLAHPVFTLSQMRDRRKSVHAIARCRRALDERPSSVSIASVFPGSKCRSRTLPADA